MSADSRFQTATRGAAIALLIAVGLFVTHKFSLTVGRAPALAFDDALATVSANLAREGRLGFDAIPFHTLAFVSQNEHFFNYGPWYFMFSAAVDWIFGTSYEIHRWPHLLGVMLSVLLASFFFKGRDRAFASAIYGCGALLSFHYHQWPMARPDIFGSIAASAALLCARLMVTSGARLWPALGLGLSVGMAVTNHPIVAALLPWSLAVIVGAAWVEEPARRWGAFRRLALSWVSGLAIPGFGLIAASGFRPGAILNLYLLYPTFIRKVGPTFGFWGSIDHHLTFVGLAPGRAQTAAAVLLVLVAIDVLFFVRRPTPAAWITLLPGTGFAAYVLSLGVFRNTHEGYEILVQLLFLWSITAIIVRMAHGLPALSGLALPLVALMMIKSQPGRWETPATLNVPYREYIDAVRADIPESARVQGEAIFALGRRNWVESAHAAILTERFLPRFRDRLSPDFLVLLEKEWEAECLHAQAEADPRLFVPAARGSRRNFGGAFNTTPWLFRDSSFRLIRIVSAPPYRSTLVYVRVEPETGEEPRPELAVWTIEGLWQRRARDRGYALAPEEEMLVTLPRPTDPSQTIEARARSAWTTALAPGTYLIEVRGARPARVSGCVVASSARSVKGSNDILSSTPRFPRGLVTYQVVDHPGGPIHVGLLSPEPAEEEQVLGVMAYRIAPLPIMSKGKEQDPVPYPAALLECLNGNGDSCRAGKR
ncbi:MAG: hypothetical protein K1Y01_21320 [Vicinamibacteria bacterium]|nr:hypothetical protein [Vicinamibacteria bacterium]